MKNYKTALRKKLDYLPLLVLIALAIVLIIKFTATNAVSNWKHYFAIITLIFTVIAFIKNHKAGVLVLGFVLLLGLIGLVSFTATIITSYFGFGKEDTSIKFSFGNPLFIILLLLHFILSGRYYFGIGTKKFWSELFNKSEAE